MNSNEVFQVVYDVSSNPSKNEKQAIVTANIDDPDFLRALEYAYNPFKTYGIRKRPVTSYGSGVFDDATWQMLDDLIARRLTGTNAVEAVRGELGRLSTESAELLWRIISKDMRAGFSESTINKAKKGTIPEFPYMRCSLPKDADLSKWPWEQGVISQEKADGMFANCDHEMSGMVSFRSRQGTEFPMDKFEEVANEIREHFKPGFQRHGEFLVLRDGVVCARQDGNGVMNHVISGGDFAANERPVFMVWDEIPLSHIAPKGKYEAPYRVRFGALVRQVMEAPRQFVKLIPTKTVKSLAEAKLHAVTMMKAGKEGSIIKHPEAIWKDSTSKDQVKIKLEFEVDLEITDIVPGREGTKNAGRAGSVRCKSSDGLLIVDVAVKNEAMRDALDANPDDWIGGIMTVIANDILEPSESNNSYTLFLPRFAEGVLRDKADADSLEKIRESKKAAIYGEELMKEAA